MKGFFITGTDTDVGKTWFTARLCRFLRQNKIDCGIWKPVQSGFPANASDSDRSILKDIAQLDDSIDEICSMTFEKTLTPFLAAKAEGKTIDWQTLMSHGSLLANKHDCMLVEGAGGIAVPITENKMMIDLAVELNLPVIIIARPGLGTINHSILTIDYLKQHGLTIAGLIMNGYDNTHEFAKSLSEIKNWTSIATNPLLIELFSNQQILGKIPLDNDIVDISDFIDRKKLINLRNDQLN